MQADLRRAARNDAAFTSLDWSEHSIESEHANLLAKSLAGNTHLQSIRIRYGIYMTANAAKRLEAALVRTCVVSAVVVGRSYSHDGRTIIRDVQANNNATLRKHCVANAARRAVQDDASLTELDWSNAGVDDDDLAVLGEALTDNTHLARITLSNSRGITDRGAALLARALATCAVVRVDIDGCHRIGRKSAAYLRRRWVSNVVRLVKSDDARLPEIDWSNTDADDDDLGQLAGALPGNTRVNAIQIAHNRLVGDAGAEALWSVLPLCNVVGVALDVTSIAEPRKAAIRCLCVANAARRLAANDSSLTSLDWRVMRHTAVDADIMTIARAMRGNTALRVVRLGGNRQLSLEPPYLQPAKEALERSLVVRLDMDGTGIDLGVQTVLRAQCVSNATLVNVRPYQRLLLATLHERPDMLGGHNGRRLLLIGRGGVYV